MTTEVYAIILAGGYAKRLWPLTLDTPKALLPIAGKPILNYIVEKLQALNPPLSRIILSTNMLFQPQYEAWLAKSGYKSIQLVPDDSFSEVEKPGAIKAMSNIIEKMPQEDVLVIAGDGMFKDSLIGFLDAFISKKASIVAVYQTESLDEARRCATIVLDCNGKILDFAEKPVAPATKTVCGAVYLFSRGIELQLKEYIKAKMPTDQPGRFVEWLYRRETVYGYILGDPLWDIGTQEAYKACDEFFSCKVERFNET